MIHNRAGRNICGIQLPEPFLRRLLQEFLLHDLDENLVVLDPVGFLHEARVVDQFLAADNLASQAPEALRRTADCDMAIGRREYLIGRAAAVPLTETFGCLAGREERRAFVEAQCDTGFEQRNIDLLSAARLLPRRQRRQDTDSAVHAGADIRHRDGQTMRRTVFVATDRRQTGHGLTDEIESAARRVRTSLPEP